MLNNICNGMFIKFYFFGYLTFMLLFSLSAHTLIVDEVDNLDLEKKYSMSVCALFKNEALYLDDWIKYHLSIGVDHFYLYNTGSRDYYTKVLQPYINKNIVTLVNWPEVVLPEDEKALKWSLSTQVTAYENAVNFLARNETDWLVFLNINEFLVLFKGSISQLMENYEEYPGVKLCTEYYDGNVHTCLSNKSLHTQAFDITETQEELLGKRVAKMIFRPDRCNGFTWPPYQCVFNQEVSLLSVDPQALVVKRFVNRSQLRQVFGKKRDFQSLAPLLEGNSSNDHPVYPLIPKFLIKLQSTLVK